MTNEQLAALVAAAQFTVETGADEMGVDPSAILSLVERLREAEEALGTLLKCPAIADGNHGEIEWYCLDTVAAERAARAYMESNDVK